MSDESRILVVEDESDVLIFVVDHLEYMGYSVFTARNGKQGLEIAQNEKPDLIVLDIMMPEMDGYEACRRLKANSATQHIPILMLTAKGQLHDKVMGFEIGADDYLSKPYPKIEFEARIKALLRRHAFVQELMSSNISGEYAHLVKLHETLNRYFDVEELRTLCFALGIDFDTLKGEGKANKARELIMYLDRRGRVSELIQNGKRFRPHISWDNDHSL